MGLARKEWVGCGHTLSNTVTINIKKQFHEQYANLRKPYTSSYEIQMMSNAHSQNDTSRTLTSTVNPSEIHTSQILKPLSDMNMNLQ